MIRRLLILVVFVSAVSTTASAWALQLLPPGAQVNNDPTAGIDGTQSVGSEDPANADVVGGALTAGKVAVPWAIFRQTESAGAHDQLFVRSFAGGAWTTRGSGTVGGSASALTTFPGSLNFDKSQDAEAPAIDFAGAGRTVPWATWYEHTTGASFGADEVFASRFDNTGDANQGKWLFEGQGRGLGGSPTPVPVPSLNLDPGKDADNPSIAGGSTNDPGNPAPWVAWQEMTTHPTTTTQIFVSRAVKPSTPPACTGVTPPSATGAVATFCWQETGVPGRSSTTNAGPEPSLNVDPTRSGEEPDIAFTGANDATPWVVWYEEGTSTLNSPLHELVFAAKAVSDSISGDGGFHWVVVGRGLQGELDTTGSTNHSGPCAETAADENACSLNADPANDDAEDPQVAAGTMTPGTPTVPWITWDEVVGTVKQVFVARLVGSGTTASFQIANDGQPISTTSTAATRSAITFDGNTPYVTWRQSNGVLFAGHFVNAADPTFVLDSSDTSITPTGSTDVRNPIASACAANPANGDGSACQGGAIGTPFALFTAGTSPRSLFAAAYQPDSLVTGPATGVTGSSATLGATLDPHGASVDVSFQYGTTTAYGQTTPVQPTGPVDGATPVSAALILLPPSTTFHYRVIATSDFGTVVGADRTFTTVAPTTPSTIGTTKLGSATVSGSSASIHASCTGAVGASCRLTVELEVRETRRGTKVVAVAAKKKKPKKPKTTHKTVVVGKTTTTLAAGAAKTLKVTLNSTGKKLLAHYHTLKCKLLVLQTVAGGKDKTLATHTVTFKAPHKKAKKKKH